MEDRERLGQTYSDFELYLFICLLIYIRCSIPKKNPWKLKQNLNEAQHPNIMH